MKLVRIPLRISLVGGGSDLPSHYRENCGGAVVSFTINKYIYISAKPNASLFPHRYRLVYSTVEQCNDRNEIKHRIIRQLVDDYGIGDLDLDVMSDLPAGTGMGSSSSFTVGLHAALGPSRDKHELAEVACETEINDLNEPIGKQDQYAATFGGLNHIQFSSDSVCVNPILLRSQELSNLLDSLHLVYVGGTRSASELLTNQNKEANAKAIAEMVELANGMAHNLRYGYLDAVGFAMAEAWELKKSLSPLISNDTIDIIIGTAYRNGATGAKLLGAGSAGFVLLFCPPQDRDKMLSGLKQLNLAYVPFNFDMEGCKVLYEA